MTSRIKIYCASDEVISARKEKSPSDAVNSARKEKTPTAMNKSTKIVNEESPKATDKPTEDNSPAMGLLVPSSSILTTSIGSDEVLEHVYYVVGDDFHFPIKDLKSLKQISRSVTELEFTDVVHIDTGSNSHVYRANRMGTVVVIKMLKKVLKYAQTAEEELRIEMQLLIKIDHPNIIAIRGAGVFPRSFIVIDNLEGGTLDKLLTENSNSSSGIPLKGLPLRRVAVIARELASALHYLHDELHPSALIIHRDLKPQNIGFGADKRLKLFDFGLAACVKKRIFANEAYKMTGLTGTLVYMAPEVALRKPYNEKVDIYSFGIILWQMVTGQSPFPNMDKVAYIEQVSIGGLRPSFTPDDSIPKELVLLIQQCWDVDPRKRPSSTAILRALDDLQPLLNIRSSFLKNLMPKIFYRHSMSCKIAAEEGVPVDNTSPTPKNESDSKGAINTENPLIAATIPAGESSKISVINQRKIVLGRQSTYTNVRRSSMITQTTTTQRPNTSKAITTVKTPSPITA
mmetsp:Transcript_11586/g.15926  ORF Transcript_11586/g.15926 Transcript_11586/m.15926 type:complete len:515 (-) Transcript_11586:301-1845(-)|eukprot:CAMPEP_0170078580 /NCGR_PEP_ID=MMETSP0019_2-20121128/15136_1 /TAXON_ID=98059 /ORGANISM="Dinobryon sp., Strain UTEXLB2267" /LENGTH=514 /DNA_ID=CAMNT_0010291529 /DNA_START=33 /DNA_END=1580 /DNA_ORIENTATION=+